MATFTVFCEHYTELPSGARTTTAILTASARNEMHAVHLAMQKGFTPVAVCRGVGRIVGADERESLTREMNNTSPALQKEGERV